MKQIFERIAKSLEVIAEELKARKEVQLEVFNRIENMESALKAIAEDPFGVNKN
ncbi:hypothetical protein [Streptococcus cuniculi]|uniref:hypothetical protein n=1 Tax=Streptococcus cuniculi TaxID=1432788 RepID=UPI00143072CB|nr:hypothetical protein [Streptococcus cuniculi]MBF0779325.1 hypothetical protein [Streptococcus cuniculi]